MVDKDNINVKLGLIQKHIKVPKNQFNKFGNYNYRSCEDIYEGVKPLLEEHDCVLTVDDKIKLIGDRYYIEATAVLSDTKTGGFVTATAYAREEENKKGMDGAQITGAASSYARKYALNGLFCLDDNKDPDTQKPKEDPPPKAEGVKKVGDVTPEKEENPKTKLMNEVIAVAGSVGHTLDDVKEYIAKTYKKTDPKKVTIQDLHETLTYYVGLSTDSQQTMEGE